MLAWLEDVIFEGLPNRLAKTWPERFLSSIAPGRDLSPVGWQFLHWLLTESRLGKFDHALIKAEVARCAETLIPLTDRRPVDVSAAEHAATVARTAMDTLSRIDGLPEAVAWSAESAALAAESAALSGFDPTASAERAVPATSSAIAGSKDYITMSEKLLELLEAA
jgi:non-ribosomal peptide synthetase component F